MADEVNALAQRAKQRSAAGLTAPLPDATHFPTCWSPPNATDLLPKLTILTVAAGMPSSYSSCLRTNRRWYAQKHGLEYCEYDAAPTRLPVNFCWHKLIAVQKLLRNSEPRREAIFWMDADALFMDMQKSAVDILSEHPLKDFIFAADYNACDRSSPGKRHALTGPSLTGRCEDTWTRRISGGIFMVRNTPAARAT